MYNFLCDVVGDKDPYVDKRKKLKNIAVKVSSHYCKDIADAIGFVK